MIGLYHDWRGAAIDPALAGRFARSLGVGTDRAVGSYRDGGSVLAAHCSGPARSWRPAVGTGGSLVLFSGYLDNAAELRRSLETATHDPAMLYATGHARWGDAVDLRAIGRYATILLRPGEPRVRLSRSPLQAPPLHIWQDRHRVIVASASRVLFAGGDVVPEIDEQKIADSLYLNYADAERGWYRGVRRAAIGAQTLLSPEALATRTYYDVANLPRVRLKRDGDYVEAANALLAEGTRAALDGFARPAVSLSGGLDSQGVAAAAIAALPAGQKLLGLTGVPEACWDGAGYPSLLGTSFFGDERAHVAALAAMYPSLETEVIDAAGLSFDHKLQAMFLLGGVTPRNVMNLHWMHAVRARAKARDCDVMLIGQMGNWSFSFDGTGALPGWLASGRWGRLRRELLHARGDRALARAFVSQAVLPLAPGPLYDRWRRWRGANESTAFDSWCPLDRDYAREMRVAERTPDMARAPRSSREWRAAAFGNAMNESGDMRQALDLIHGIPSRDPTAYRPLVEFCLGIPDDQYLRDGERRFLARRMLRGKIPDLVVDETRRGRQAADWPLRIARDRPALIVELDRLADDPAMARRLDLPRLRAALTAWSPANPGDRPLRDTIEHAVPRAIATARFIRFVEGSN